MADWKDWSPGWLKENNNISFTIEGVTYYERVVMRDLAHYEYEWPETISATTESGPQLPADLEVTRGYADGLNRIWQMIFGIKGQIYIYIELPTDLKRHGIPKKAWPSSELRRVAHFEEYMSPYHEPTFLTEHFMMRPVTARIDFLAYNPGSIDQTDVWLNILIAKMVTERIGTERYDQAGLHLTPTKPQFEKLLNDLYQRIKPCRPITLQPVRAPAEAPAGE